MFTGIIETIGIVENIKKQGNNTHFELSCDFTDELKIDQSVSHNGCCLTVVAINGNKYTVTAIDETLQKTNLNFWKIGTKINLERCVKVNDRLDGHMVQGHVDTVAKLEKIEDKTGSFNLHFSHQKGNYATVEKGSICVNGISLTVVDSTPQTFSVAIIPYTWEFTNLHELQTGDFVNIEFDILGKYVQQLLKQRFDQ